MLVIATMCMTSLNSELRDITLLGKAIQLCVSLAFDLGFLHMMSV